MSAPHVRRDKNLPKFEKRVEAFLRRAEIYDERCGLRNAQMVEGVLLHMTKKRYHSCNIDTRP